MAITISQRLATLYPTPNVDANYGPYRTIRECLNTLAVPGSILAVNGLTVGIETVTGVVEDYEFVNITSGTTPTASNLVKKVSNATITIQQEGQQPQTFTLNQGENVTITLSKGVTAWNDITDKPTFATVATTGAYSDLSGAPTIPAAQVNSDWNSESGVSQILNKPDLSHVVYFEDVPSNNS